MVWATQSFQVKLNCSSCYSTDTMAIGFYFQDLASHMKGFLSAILSLYFTPYIFQSSMKILLHGSLRHQHFICDLSRVGTKLQIVSRDILKECVYIKKMMQSTIKQRGGEDLAIHGWAVIENLG